MLQPVRLALYLVGVILAFMAVAPLFWMLSMSLKPSNEVFEHESHPAASDARQFRLRVHPGRFRPLSLQHVLRFRRSDGRRARSFIPWRAMRWRVCGFPGATRSFLRCSRPF